MSNTNNLITVPQAATKLGMSVQSLMRLAKRADIGLIRVSPRCVRFSDAKINEYLDTCRVAPEAR